MNDKFDELARGLAQSVTRRGALKKFGLGLAGIALASLGLANKLHAQSGGHYHCNCHKPDYGCAGQKYENLCYANCPAICQY